MSTGDSSSTEAKLARLREILSEVGGTVVAFSGGVGSSLLVTVAHEVTGDRLVSHIPYGEPLEDGTLWRIDGAESFLRRLGYDPVRVRAHSAAAGSSVARIEVAPEKVAEFAGEHAHEAAVGCGSSASPASRSTWRATAWAA